MVWVGTSGYNYPEWKGSFYPDDLAAKKMLPYYAARFPTVEINYTFYRMPTEKLVASWAEQVPSPYRFTLKAPRRITHDSRLKDATDSTARFCEVAATLGDKLGTLLFQLPPFLRKDLALLDAFLPTLPAGVRAAFEFRPRRGSMGRVRPSAGRTCGLSPTASSLDAVRITATTRKLRLRDEGYQPDDIKGWADTITAKTASCRDVFVYFKHEESGKGPEFARLLMDHLGLK
jgi:uncharacterized protein YecE (DUF72 family)